MRKKVRSDLVLETEVVSKTEILSRAVTEGIYYIVNTCKKGEWYKCVRFATHIVLEVSKAGSVTGLDVDDSEAVDLSLEAYKTSWAIDRKDLCVF